MAEGINEKEKVEDIRQSKKYIKITLIRKILFSTSILTIWAVSAIFNIIDLKNGIGYFQSPWTYLTLLITILLILTVIIPLRRNIKKDIEQLKREKEEVK
ncbi:MAG: hypothetical protein K9W46_01410 [Candidatus Heimdallarchaeum endolithica]|uniref:Uncharacterized protein n=1 Tax=Candidatus Heimdallarchaeum endolithica TaxID=2876572 RepID=A0A9Y1FPM8_9ARCH|nr:MAG: hypothetical protein K9W46_01410 [Candidatus Heimdallarchaeum endolithica]